MTNKKAIFYTTAAIALTAVIIMTYTTYTSLRLSQKMDVVRTRVETVNFFIKDVEDDIAKGAYIAGFRTLLSFNQYIANNGTYLDNVNARFMESFLNGTINKQPQSLMTDSTFVDWANRISAESDKIDIFFNFTINGININHSDPFSVDVDVNLTLYIYDKKNTSQWIRDRQIKSRISIIGFEDPIYIVNSNGRVSNSVIISNISPFVTNGNPGNLLLHENNSYYMPHNDSPSFLMRMEGNLGNSAYGIESLVNLEEFQNNGIALKDRSIVDYIYFGTQSTTNFRINQTPDWFKIDQEHLDFYQVTNITI